MVASLILISQKWGVRAAGSSQFPTGYYNSSRASPQVNWPAQTLVLIGTDGAEILRRSHNVSAHRNGLNAHCDVENARRQRHALRPDRQVRLSTTSVCSLLLLHSLRTRLRPAHPRWFRILLPRGCWLGGRSLVHSGSPSHGLEPPFLRPQLPCRYRCRASRQT